MDTEAVAEELVDAVEQLSNTERARLRSITDLAPGEIDSLTAALDQHPGPLAEVALKLIGEWDQMKDAERVASLLALRQILIWGVPRGR
jgi:hypothetical protein